MRQFSWPAQSFWPSTTASSAKTTTLLLCLLASLPQAQSIQQLLPDPRDRCAEIKARHPQDNDLIVTNATFVEAHALNLSGTFNALPFCRLASRLAYGSNDSLNFEVWLPDDVEYNGRFLAVGMSSHAPCRSKHRDVTIRR